jgi:hypothetical protein
MPATLNAKERRKINLEAALLLSSIRHNCENDLPDAKTWTGRDEETYWKFVRSLPKEDQQSLGFYNDPN